MFFFEWFVPLLLIVITGIVVLFLAIRNRVGNESPGIRTDGRILVDKPDVEQSPTSES